MGTWLSNGTILDCAGGPPRRGSVLIEGDRISRIITREPSSDDGDHEVVAVDGMTILPGLWTVHTHPGDLWPTTLPIMESETSAERGVRAGRNFLEALAHGITGIRVCGESDYIDVAWKRAFQTGVFLGPRVFASGYALIATGGHGQRFKHSREVDGAVGMRQAARDQFKGGADHIKICVTGAEVLLEHGRQGEVQLTVDEIEAATEVAHAKGSYVAAHAGSADGVKRAVRAGVDCIEHGYDLDDEAIALMVAAGTYLVPTLNCTAGIDFFAQARMTASQIEQCLARKESHETSIRRAATAGVKIVCGSDNSPIGEVTLYEIELMTRAGLTPNDALTAATRTAAELCGVGDDTGTIEVGKAADLVVIDGDPLRDITAIRRTSKVFREGIAIAPGSTRWPAGWWSQYY